MRKRLGGEVMRVKRECVVGVCSTLRSVREFSEVIEAEERIGRKRSWT